jgi:hypothetical protein
MSRPDREPIGLTVLKVIAAVVLVLLALAFGAGGACGVWFAGSGIWDAVSRRGTGLGGDEAFGSVCAVIGLGAAILLGWTAIALLRKKENRDE